VLHLEVTLYEKWLENKGNPGKRMGVVEKKGNGDLNVLKY
jgi:hypothetical protein